MVSSAEKHLYVGKTLQNLDKLSEILKEKTQPEIPPANTIKKNNKLLYAGLGTIAMIVGLFTLNKQYTNYNFEQYKKSNKKAI